VLDRDDNCIDEPNAEGRRDEDGIAML